MQPYFLPYLGYFQLIAAADVFVVYDNIKYTKKGWINRNRYLLNGTDALFSIPLKKDSDNLHVNQRLLSADFDREKLLNKLSGAYARAPHFDEIFPILENIVRRDETNLFNFIHYSIVEICRYLTINTVIKKSSEINIDHDLKGEQKVLAICETLGATTYINASGGKALYSKETFLSHGVVLSFIQTQAYAYTQFCLPFVPGLSVIDVMMFNDVQQCKQLIGGYSLA